MEVEEEPGEEVVGELSEEFTLTRVEVDGCAKKSASGPGCVENDCVVLEGSISH